MRRSRWAAGLAATALSVTLLALPGTVATSAATLAPTAGTLAAGLPARTQTPFCPSWNGLHTLNPYVSAMGGYVKIAGFASVKVGSGGSVAWGANPYKNASWRVWFTGLKWVGGLVMTSLGRGVTVGGVTRSPTDAERQAALDRAAVIVRGYLAANPRVASAPTTEQVASMGHRTQVLACLSEALGSPTWLATAARAHAAYIASNWKGSWNQGLEQDLGALAVGCLVGPSSIATAAAARMDYALRRSILADGSNNEQAPGYAAYSYVQWSLALDRLQRCGITPSANFARVPALATFVAHATQPDGRLVQLGDTINSPTVSWPGTATEYAASRGALGTAPVARVGVYPVGGYVFGRSTWSPMPSASYYTLRFGPGTALHGHFDHSQVTWYARGHHVLMDTGHIGYTRTADRKVLWQQAAHNVLTLDGVNPTHNPTSLLRSVQTEGYDAYTVRGVPNPGVTRTRGVLVTHAAGQADVMVVTDNAAATVSKLVPRPTVGIWRQHFHLPPGWTAVRRSADRIDAYRGTEQVNLIRVPVVGTTSKRSSGIVASFQAPDINRKVANLDVQFLSTGWATRTVTVVVPTAKGTPVSVTRVRNADATTTLTVTVGASVQLITLDAAGYAISSALPAPPAPPVDVPVAPAS